MSDGLTTRLPLRRIPPSGVTIALEATAEERLALAEHLDLPEIGGLEGRFHILAPLGGVVHATLDLSATVTRVSVVSLEPFAVEIAESAKLRFVPAGLEDEDEALDPDAPDDIPYSGESLDLGAALAEQLALALDPYPRRPDETLPASLSSPERDGAFAALARLRDEREK